MGEVQVEQRPEMDLRVSDVPGPVEAALGLVAWVHMPGPFRTSRGEPHPLGATVGDGGVNFSLFSRNADWVELLLFEDFNDESPVQTIRLDRNHRTFSYWHVFVHGARESLLYAYRVHGPFDPGRGHRFNAAKVVIDPYAKGIVYRGRRTHAEACSPQDNIATAMKSLVVDPSNFDWEGVKRPRIDPTDRIIYEVHVRGFTKDRSSRVGQPGSFAGFIEKIPYLKELGVTTVELLPVFQYDEHDVPFSNPATGEPLRNYWGYNPIGFFAPHRGYYVEDWEHMRYLTGFRDLVRELHRAGIEVFLDVVYNHTAEGNENGPTMSFRALENSVYYILNPENPSEYANYSGVGNTLNCNHPVVRRLVLDSLRYWAEVMHVDGFRFDLASILARDELGRPTPNPPLPWEIEADPVLQRTHLIAEAWDAGGLYQVGGFPGERWSEWNGKFRDDVRRFVRGDFGLAGAMAARMLGSPDLYETQGREPIQSVNFVSCHDGFTMNDLVSYASKHNEANGEAGRDGHNDNLSANYGVEGPSADLATERLRTRQVKNMLAITLLAQGTPMLLGGDEFRRTQHGNNNAYCQDNETSWFDWSRRGQYSEVFRFTKQMIAFRKAHPSLRRRKYILGVDAPDRDDPDGATRIRWHGTLRNRPDFTPGARVLAYELTPALDDVGLHVMMNFHDAPLEFELPTPGRGYEWRRVIDTSLPAPWDISEADQGAHQRMPTYRVPERSIVVMAQMPAER